MIFDELTKISKPPPPLRPKQVKFLEMLFGDKLDNLIALAALQGANRIEIGTTVFGVEHVKHDAVWKYQRKQALTELFQASDDYRHAITMFRALGKKTSNATTYRPPSRDKYK